MNNTFLHKNLTTIIVVAATVLLGGVAVFTGLRLFQLRNEPVAPNAPQSEPQAANEGVILTIPLETVKRGPGQHLLATQDVSQYSGLVCEVTATAQNQGSVHPDNDLVVASGGGSVVVPDVEREAGGVFSASGTLTLGSTVTVTLEMGPDEVFSAGIDVSLDCIVPTPTPTPQIVTQSCTDLAFALSTPTSTAAATPTATPTSTPTATPTATSTPNMTPEYPCNSKCTLDSQCQKTDSNYVCHDEAGQTTCRHRAYTSQENCQPPTSTPTSTATTTARATATATPAALPQAGVGTPTIVGIGAGILLLLGALALAL